MNQVIESPIGMADLLLTAQQEIDTHLKSAAGLRPCIYYIDRRNFASSGGWQCHMMSGSSVRLLNGF
jgi:hypothetical protein